MSFKNYLLFFSFFVPLFYCSGVKAQGDLFINPKRIVFDGHKRAEEISLANIGNDTARYLISFVQIRLKENGEFEQIEKPDSGQYFAAQNLRIFPRTVTLGPKETQIIKVQLYQQEKLAAGEYRSHLFFRGVPLLKPLATADEKKEQGNVTVKIIPVFGISIPVIIKVGQSDTKVMFSNLQFLPGTKPKVTLTLRRKGNMSTYGDIDVTYVSLSGKLTKVGTMRGLAVYTPNLLRNIVIELKSSSEVNFKDGKLQFSYTDTKNGRTEQLAVAELAL